MSFVEIVVRLLGILLRECTYKGFLLAIFSLSRYSVSLILENKLRSGLVVPDKHPAIDHAGLVDAGSRILFHGKVSEFGPHLPFLQDEFDKFNVTGNENSVNISESSLPADLAHS
jgi:hypothetical protein